eukprot:1303674-Alexandrium_andersonii.AAC.1
MGLSRASGTTSEPILASSHYHTDSKHHGMMAITADCHHHNHHADVVLKFKPALTFRPLQQRGS